MWLTIISCSIKVQTKAKEMANGFVLQMVLWIWKVQKYPSQCHQVRKCSLMRAHRPEKVWLVSLSRSSHAILEHEWRLSSVSIGQLFRYISHYIYLLCMYSVASTWHNQHHVCATLSLASAVMAYKKNPWKLFWRPCLTCHEISTHENYLLWYYGNFKPILLNLV